MQRRSLKQNENVVEKFIKLQINILDSGKGLSEHGLKSLFMDFGKLSEIQDQN